MLSLRLQVTGGQLSGRRLQRALCLGYQGSLPAREELPWEQGPALGPGGVPKSVRDRARCAVGLDLPAAPHSSEGSWWVGGWGVPRAPAWGQWLGCGARMCLKLGHLSDTGWRWGEWGAG